MRKSFLFTVLFLGISFLGFSQQWNNVTSDTPVTIKKSLVSSSEKEIVIDVQVGGFFSKNVDTPNGKQKIISVEDMATMLEAGAPDLPMYPISMIIGDRAEMTVEVIESEYTDIQDIEIAPSKGNLNRQINPDDVPYTYGAMYQKDAFYPAQQASLESPYILRDFRGQNVMVYPFTYNPVAKTLRVYQHLVISAKKVSDNGENPKVNRKSNIIKVDPEVLGTYERRFINFGQNGEKYTFLEDEGEMLIVCVDDYLEALQPLVDWKNISGRPTTMVASSETGTDNQLKAYIQNVYDTNPNLTFILLVGEHNNLPAHPMSGGRSDNFYGMLEGNDYYIEALVGRLSVNSVQDATNQVNKIIYYERDMDETDTWVSTGIGVSRREYGSGHYGEDDYEHIDFIRDTLLNYTYTTVTQQYEDVPGIPQTSQAAINDNINSGASIINYCNHGSTTSWSVAGYSVTNIHQLVNDYKWPFVWAVACYNGQFDYGECFAEAWMRATNNTTGAPTGAVGGMFSWISQPWIPPMYGQDEMVDILTEWRTGYKHTLGGSSLNGNMYILDMSPEDQGETHNTWILFGDPSLMVRTANPTSMNVTANPSTLLIGMTEITVNADTEYGIATLSMNGEILGSANIDNNAATITFDALSQVGTAQLVVIGYNKVTTIMDIDVVPAEGAYMVYDSYELNDQNGQMDYGENINLSVSVKNVGSDPANDITAVFSSESEYVTINSNMATIAELGANQTFNIEDAFNFDVAVNVPDNTKIAFKVTCTSGSNTWECPFTITAHAPEFKVESILTDVTEVLPGNTANLIFTIANKGTSTAYNTVLELISSSTDITFTDVSYTIEEIPAGETAEVTAEFTVAEDVELGSTYELTYIIAAGYYTTSGSYNINVGNIIEGFETGDFSAYNWVLSGSKEWTIVPENPHSGVYCAQSGRIGNSQNTNLELTVEVLANGELSFYKKVSSETNYDKLHFYIDGVEKGTWSGEVAWEQESYPITIGTHTFKWSYTKDYSVLGGSDCAWIDDIHFPPTNVVQSLEPVTNLIAEVENMTVTLTWTGVAEADEYIVLRDGEEVATQANTTFTEELTDGVYCYTVIAKNNEGAYSAPACVTVSVGIVNIIEVEENKINVYPNPTTGILNVDVPGSFDVTIYNCQGQVVMKQTQNNRQIDLSNLANGIYFVEIRTNDNVAVNKIILK